MKGPGKRKEKRLALCRTFWKIYINKFVKARIAKKEKKNQHGQDLNLRDRSHEIGLNRRYNSSLTH